jgi:hypothetical protein
MKIEELKEFYSQNQTARVVCDHMANRERNQSETKLPRILRLLEQERKEVKKSDVIAMFRKLQDFECGEFIAGRKGWQTRFVWSVGSLGACKAASGEIASVVPLGPADDAPSEKEVLNHDYNLRSDLVVKFALPVDLTEREAKRLADFINSLPLEDYE